MVVLPEFMPMSQFELEGIAALLSISSSKRPRVARKGVISRAAKKSHNLTSGLSA